MIFFDNSHYFSLSEWQAVRPMTWLQEAPKFCQKAPKSAKKSATKNFQKSANIWGKSATNLTPQTIFIAFLCINFLEMTLFL